MAREMDATQYNRIGEILPHQLKICDLCGSLNIADNRECFVCNWAGRFETDEAKVEDAMTLAVRRVGRLELHHVADLSSYCPPPPPTLTVRAKRFARTVNRRIRSFISWLVVRRD